MKSVGPPSRAEFHEAISNRSDRWYAALQLLRKYRPGVFEPLEIAVADHSNSPEVRAQAWFWLAQNDSDEAFEYFDRMLGSN